MEEIKYVEYPSKGVDFSKVKHVRLSNKTKKLTGKIAEQLTNVTSLLLPESLDAIEGTAFLGMRHLREIGVDNKSKNYKVIDGCLFSHDGSSMHLYLSNKKENCYQVPSFVKVIKEGAFSHTKYSPDMVKIGSNVENVESNAFWNGFTKCIHVASGVRYDYCAFAIRGIVAFEDKNQATEDDSIPRADVFIGIKNVDICYSDNCIFAILDEKAYLVRVNMVEISEQENYEISTEEFENLKQRNEIDVPSSIFSNNIEIPVCGIVQNAGYLCGSSKNRVALWDDTVKIKIPSTVESISPEAFYPLFTDVEFNVDVTNEHFTSVRNSLYDKGQTKLLAYSQGEDSALKKMELPSTVTTIGEYAFSDLDCELLIVPSGVENFHCLSVVELHYLKSLVIPGGCRLIEPYQLLDANVFVDSQNMTKEGALEKECADLINDKKTFYWHGEWEMRDGKPFILEDKLG